MINRSTNVGNAVALLESANPVDHDRLAAELDSSSDWERVSLLIAGDGALQPGPRTTRRTVAGLLMTRARVRVIAASVAAAAVMAVLALALNSGTSAVQSASAKTISGALGALTAPTGSILHIDATTTQISTGHPTYRWEQDIYEQLSRPYLTRVVDKRLPGTPPGTEAVNGMRIAEQIFDPINNTVYRPTAPKPKPQSGERTLTPAEEAHLFEPFMAKYIRSLQAKLASGAARVDGRASVDGRAAMRIRFAGSDEVDYVAADGSYAPIETITGTPASADGQLISVFHAFAYLPAVANANLLSLTAQHPTARIDRSLADFRAALKRQFRDG
ncbi:MAG: hypothetical protein M3Y09_09140 [Actinomycetota bacterium]|nr:hypothetical protein [Actinomycetota bacterium]